MALLGESECGGGELAAPYEMSLQAVSKHIKVLEDARMVTKTRHGQQRTVHLEAKVFHLMTKWIERYQRQAEQRFQQLDAVLAEMAGSDRRLPRPTERRAHHDYDNDLSSRGDRGRSECSDHSHHTRLSGDPDPADGRSHRPGVVCSLGRT